MTVSAMLHLQQFLDEICDAANAADVFGSVEIRDGAVLCAARDSSAEAWYSIVREGNAWLVRLATPDRWLSESIEADLMHHGDPIEELIEEELIELDHDVKRDGPMPAVKHFRSDERWYTFQSPLVLPAGTSEAAALAARYLLAYEAAFRELGDMQGGQDE